MNLLNCSVENCANNKNHMCSLQKIKVEGPGACVPSQTCCYSFATRGNAENVVARTSDEETNILCKAENCKHNKRGHCNAENVTITNIQGISNVMSETECLTFSAR